MRRIRIQRIGDINFDFKEINIIKNLKHHRHHHAKDFSGIVWNYKDFFAKIDRLEEILKINHDLLKHIYLNKYNQFNLLNSIYTYVYRSIRVVLKQYHVVIQDDNYPLMM
jgi:hypothetical protein